MPKFMIEVPHSPEECASATGELVHHPRARELAARTYWGCGDGAHTTWILAEFDSKPEARGLIPRLLRDTALVVRIERGPGPDEVVAPRRGVGEEGGPYRPRDVFQGPRERRRKWDAVPIRSVTPPSRKGD
jgi:hypothetical protein